MTVMACQLSWLLIEFIDTNQIIFILSQQVITPFSLKSKIIIGVSEVDYSSRIYLSVLKGIMLRDILRFDSSEKSLDH